jgi:hypothetical protein
MKQRIIALLLISCVPILGFADTGTYQRRSTTTTDERTTAPIKKDYTFKDTSYFHDHEMSVDLFGGYVFADGPGRLTDDFAGGIGANYFFTRNLGLGLDGYWWDGDQVSNEIVSAFSGSLILRMPLDKAHLAPYIFGGGGGTFSGIDQATLHGGGGLEYRFTPHLGTFVDGRYVFTDSSNDYGLVRFGARFVF